MVKSGSCTYPSNHLSKLWIADLAKFQKRDSSCSIILETVNKNNFGITVSYQWQKSTDSLTWSNVSGATSSNYIVNRVSVSGYFRLKATAGNCTVYSAGYYPLPEFTITQQPVDVGACNNMAFNLNVVATNNYLGLTTYNWQYHNTISDFWTGLQIGSSGFYTNFASSFNHEQEFRCKISSACGEISTKVVSLKKVIPAKITEWGFDTTIGGGEDIALYAKWTGELPATSVIWKRSTNPEGGIWSILDTTQMNDFNSTVPNYTQIH
jgi:hypothetical protein